MCNQYGCIHDEVGVGKWGERGDVEDPGGMGGGLSRIPDISTRIFTHLSRLLAGFRSSSAVLLCLNPITIYCSHITINIFYSSLLAINKYAVNNTSNRF
jgi:hypothetical protein